MQSHFKVSEEGCFPLLDFWSPSKTFDLRPKIFVWMCFLNVKAFPAGLHSELFYVFLSILIHFLATVAEKHAQKK